MDRFLVSHWEEGGERHYLAGEPVHAGSLVDLWTADGWRSGRYEATWEVREITSAYVVFPDDTCRVLSSDSELRWSDR